ncbi:MAG: adhesion protein-coupled receptor E1-like [Myxococcaceae bacterium]|nr:adhesion protein-coupled receptor E1-like [Myxococcaceae bacterium]
MSQRYLQVLYAITSVVTLGACEPGWSGEGSGQSNQTSSDGGVDSGPKFGDAQKDSAQPSLPVEGPDAGPITVSKDLCSSCDPRARCDPKAGALCTCPADRVDERGDGSLCSDPCAQAGCDPHASCKAIKGLAECACTAPYAGDGMHCETPQDCSTLKCASNQECATQAGKSACNCKSGYELKNGSCVDIDECATQTPCHAGQRCTNADGSYQCTACESAPNMVVDSSFELQDGQVAPPWYTGSGGPGNPTEVLLNQAHTGKKSVRITSTGPWQEIMEYFTVEPNTRYTASVYVRSSDNLQTLEFGVRDHTTLGTERAVQKSGPLGSFTRLTTTFDTESWTVMDLWIGTRTTVGSVWIEVDDVTLQKAAISCL